jgi:hypothetical protein
MAREESEGRFWKSIFLKHLGRNSFYLLGYQVHRNVSLHKLSGSHINAKTVGQSPY